MPRKKKEEIIKEAEEKAKDILADIDFLLGDRTIPRNIKKALTEVKTKVEKEYSNQKEITEAIYIVDDISNDINLPLHAKTDLWNLLSKLESLKETIKKL